MPILIQEQLSPPTASPRTPTRRAGRGLGGRLIRWALLMAGVGVVAALLSLALLALADYDMAGNGSSSSSARLAWVWERGDHLHFAVHIAQGRLFDICPCTRRAADYQYYKAHFHAVTPSQVALAANTHPHTPSQWVAYVAGPAVVSLDWMRDAMSWVAGQRPTQQATVVLDQYEFQPPEIHVARGTTVTWRNVDEEGEAHTVTADAGQSVKFGSDFLLPDESFRFTFTERGRYAYYCRLHGEPGQQGQVGMTGIVIVE